MPTHQSAEQIRKDYFQKLLLNSPSSHSNLSQKSPSASLHLTAILPIYCRFRANSFPS